MSGRRNGSDTLLIIFRYSLSNPDELRGRDIAQNIGVRRCRKLLHMEKKITLQERNCSGGTAKGEISKDSVVRRRLAAMCCQAVVICGCL